MYNQVNNSSAHLQEFRVIDINEHIDNTSSSYVWAIGRLPTNTENHGKSLIGFTVVLTRNPSPFFTNTYLPTGLLTIISFIGFLIPVDKVPGRMALLVTIFLMLVNISSTERNRGPIVRNIQHRFRQFIKLF